MTNMPKNDWKAKNRARLDRLLSNIPSQEAPIGWSKVARLAIGGLLTAGFSKEKAGLLLVVSHSGRSVIDGRTGEKIARDYDEYEGLKFSDLSCAGIGPLAEEKITICGENAGGIPHSNSEDERLELVAPRWPEQELIFCPTGTSALSEGYQSGCCRVYCEHIRAYGFSWCGDYFVAGCSSDIDLWRREIAS